MKMKQLCLQRRLQLTVVPRMYVVHFQMKCFSKLLAVNISIGYDFTKNPLRILKFRIFLIQFASFATLLLWKKVFSQINEKLLFAI